MTYIYSIQIQPMGSKLTSFSSSSCQLQRSISKLGIFVTEPHGTGDSFSFSKQFNSLRLFLLLINF